MQGLVAQSAASELILIARAPETEKMSIKREDEGLERLGQMIGSRSGTSGFQALVVVADLSPTVRSRVGKLGTFLLQPEMNTVSFQI